MTKKELQTSGGNLPSYMDDVAGKYAGAGVASGAEDNLIPMVRVLQDMSPQVKPKNAEYVDGATAGMMYCGVLNLLFEKARFQPCAFQKGWVEWKPRGVGGGFVAQHAGLPDGAVDGVDGNGNPCKKLGDNELVETRYHFGRLTVDGQTYPVVLPFTSTGHTVSKGFMTMLNNQRHNGKVLPSFVKDYNLTTVQKSNASGEWSVMQFDDPQWVAEDDIAVGAAMFDGVMSGQKAAGHEDEPDTNASESF